MGRSAVHEAVGDDRPGVADGHADGVLRLLQDQRVGLVVADQELEKGNEQSYRKGLDIITQIKSTSTKVRQNGQHFI